MKNKFFTDEFPKPIEATSRDAAAEIFAKHHAQGKFGEDGYAHFVHPHLTPDYKPHAPVQDYSCFVSIPKPGEPCGLIGHIYYFTVYTVTPDPKKS